MDERRKTKNTHTSSTGIDDHLKNVNNSEKFVWPTSNDPEIRRILKFMEVCSPSGSRIPKIEAYSEGGLELWVDLKIDRNPQDDLEDLDLSRPPSPQGSSPQGRPSASPQGLSPEERPTASPQGSSRQACPSALPQGLSSQALPTTSPQSSSPQARPTASLEGSLAQARPTASHQGSPPQAQLSYPQTPFGSYVNTQRVSDLLIPVSPYDEVSKIKITKLASVAMQELTRLALARDHVWKVDIASNTEVLSDVEYMRMVEVRESQSPPNLDINKSHEFAVGTEYRADGLRQNPVSSESSRETTYFYIRPISIIEILMDLRQWSQAFSNIVSKATLVEVLASTGVENNYDGTLQVMAAEFHAPTPLIPTRESYFARYCKKVGSGLWGVVDVSLENLFHIPSRNFRRRPSGCLIEEMPNGCCKVIWVEHVEVDNRLVHHSCQPLVSSGFAFGAKRWINSLIRQFHYWLATLRASSSPADGSVIIPQPESAFYLKLTERIVRGFFMNISASTENQWMPLPVSGADVRMVVKSSTDDPGKPPGTTIMFATSIHLPIPRNQVFGLLRDPKFRKKWDIYARNHIFEDCAYMTNGYTPGNRVSILRAIHNETKQIETILYLQESYTDSTGSYIVYAPFDYEYARTKWIEDENADHIPILPSGFSILPDRPMHWDETGGSLLTIAFHILAGPPTDDDYVPSDQQVLFIHNIIAKTVMSIKQGLGLYI